MLRPFKGSQGLKALLRPPIGLTSDPHVVEASDGQRRAGGVNATRHPLPLGTLASPRIYVRPAPSSSIWVTMSPRRPRPERFRCIAFRRRSAGVTSAALHVLVSIRVVLCELFVFFGVGSLTVGLLSRFVSGCVVFLLPSFCVVRPPPSLRTALRRACLILGAQAAAGGILATGRPCVFGVGLSAALVVYFFWRLLLRAHCAVV